MPQVEIVGFHLNGTGLGEFEGKEARVWNAIPGELVDFKVARKQQGYISGVAHNIVKTSTHRISPPEMHFLSCSPWQILCYEMELCWKKKNVQELFGHEKDIDIYTLGGRQYNYRNKMEYSFTEFDGDISLAFFKREGREKISIFGCELAHPCINEAAQRVLDWINLKKIPLRSLKSLIIRSDGESRAIAGLFIKDKLLFADYPELCQKFVGFSLYYSTHKSPASVPTELLYSKGENTLLVWLNDVKFTYDLFSFFQVNVPVFHEVLKDIGNFLDGENKVLDFYSGVGAISLSLADRFKQAILVDNHSESIAGAQANIKDNGLSSCQAKEFPAEKITELIEADDVVIFDPPRTGLHRKVIERVLQERPKRIIYLSCNVVTQAEGIKLLEGVYKTVFHRLYNFFPRTPHIESLCVLDRSA
ncbi:MAG: methyltransferase [Candidatus Margulisiibacteriota bacterium]